MTESTYPDLTTCDREPIHIPGSIQPHGVLLGIDDDETVRFASDNFAEIFGAEAALPRDLAELLPSHELDLGLLDAGGLAQFAGRVSVGGAQWDAFAHRSGEQTLLELERASPEALSASGALSSLLAITSRIAEAPDLAGAARAAAETVREVTGYDRVMIYRFLDDESGQVIAEDRTDGVESFLNHRYPASDIPKQARALYLENRVRVIPHVDYVPVPLPQDHDATDLSGALLRSVSPVHLQYLKNMDVGASASISIVSHGTLWGLIACHHRSARAIGHERRQMCLHIAQTLEQALGRLEEETLQREALRLMSRRDELLPHVAGAEGLVHGLLHNADELRNAIPCDGLAIAADRKVVRTGVTPEAGEIEGLVRWLSRPSSPAFFASDSLANEYPPAARWSAVGSGLLSIVISRRPRLALLWFRAEEVETVNWAGNPHKPVEGFGKPGLLTPRASFDLWVETVRNRSRPWRPAECAAARDMMARLLDVARQQDMARLNERLSETVVAREEALAEKDLLVREVHHRVQNNLQLVTSMLRIQEGEIADDDARRHLELARDRIHSIALLHRRLWRSDDLQTVNLEAFFGDLVEELERTWGEAWAGMIQTDLAPITVSGQSALMLGLVVTEILTNALKHAYGGAPGPVRLTAAHRGKSRIEITVADRGVGTETIERRGSFGSRLINRITQQLKGELTVAANNPGTTVTLALPAST